MSSPAFTAVGAPRTRAANLAFWYQEILMAVEWLRSGEAPGDAVGFRASIRKALDSGERAAREAGYAAPDVNLASFAVIAFLDETILNSTSPAFRDWPRNPMMLERFNTLLAGELFFEHLRTVLQRSESPANADMLEIYALCLILGFRGRFAGESDELQRWRTPVLDKIRRYKPDSEEFGGGWRPVGAVVAPKAGSRWLPLALSTAAAILVADILLFGVYSYLLGGGVDRLSAIVR
jgi:type VI secretion system protein ImpK